MMKKTKKYFTKPGAYAMVVFIYLGMTSLSGFGQDGGSEWDKGAIEDIEIVIPTTRENTVPSATRNFENIPPRPSEVIVPPIRYDFQSFSFLAPQINPQIRP